MIFLWSWRNEEHIGKHHVRIEEAEFVMGGMQPPDPELLGDEKRSVWGPSDAGRYLQVIYVYVSLEDVEPDEYLQLELRKRIALEEGEEAVRIIHARDLTRSEKQRLRRRRD